MENDSKSPDLRKGLCLWLNNLQRFTNENALLKEQIQNLAAEIEAVKMFMKEQLYVLKKA